MPTARVTFKGQVTIPKEIRERLGIETGDFIVFVPLGRRVVIERIPRPSVAQLKGALPASRRYPGSAILREEAEEAAVADVMRRMAVPDEDGADQR